MPNLKLNDLRNAYEINSDEELNLLYWAYLFNHQYNLDNPFEQDLAKETSILLSVDFNADINTVVASLIYRTVAKLNYSDDEVKKLFNEEIMKKVRILTKFNHDLFELDENDRVIAIESLVEDVKIVIIKLVERVALLHNIDENSLVDHNKIINDTLDFYVPLSQLLGIYKIKNSLEDSCFRYDDNYDETSVIVNKVRERNNDIISFINRKFSRTRLPFKNDIKFVLNKKSNYDIYLKSLKLSEDVNVFKNENDFKISGFCSVKCLTKNKTECYQMLSFIHNFGYQFGTFLDYISDFQGDEYRALHTNVFINNHLVDFRICTTEMNKANYFGITNNWKENPDLQAKLISNYAFYDELKNLISNNSYEDIPRLFRTNIIDKRVDVSEYKACEKQKRLK